MAQLNIKLFINSLHRHGSFDMFIPNDGDGAAMQESSKYTRRPMKTLVWLHGYTGFAENWLPEDVARRYNVAVISPNGENGFYTDGDATGHKYQSMIMELVTYVRNTFGLATKREDTYIAGLSMGGYGAIHCGLAYPEVFTKIGAMSSALIVKQVAGMKPGEDNGTANYDYYRGCFGDLDRVTGSLNNPEMQIKNLEGRGLQIPGIFMCCGTEDFLIEPNRDFHNFLTNEGVNHIYKEGPGIHDNVFWSKYILEIADWMFE